MITPNTSPSDAIKFNHLTEIIFSRYGIEYTQKNSISKESNLKKLDCDFVIDVLNYFDQFQDVPLVQFEQYSVPVLVDYLQKSHAYYLTKKLPEIEQSIEIISSRENGNFLGISILKLFFDDYKNELIAHFAMEEEELFPYAKKLHRAIHQQNLEELHVFQEYSVNDFERLHEESHEELTQVRKAILNYTPSDINESPYRILLEQLNNFEKDLSFHSLIEDEILVPKLHQLENHFLLQHTYNQGV